MIEQKKRGIIMNVIKNMKVRKKLLLLVSFMIAVTLLMGSMAVMFMGNINNASTEISQNWMPSVIIAQEINTTTSDYRIQELSHVISEDKEEMEELEQAMKEYETQIEEGVKEYEKVVTNETDKGIMDKVSQQWAEYLEIHNTVIDLSRQGKTEEAMELLNNKSLEIFDHVSNAMLELVSFNKDGGEQASIESDNVYKTAFVVMMIIIVISIAILLIVALAIISSIMKPVKILDVAAEKIAAGDLDAKIDYESKDELGQLAVNFGLTVNRLKEYVDYIDEIAMVLTELSDGNLQINLKYEYAGEFAKIKKALLDTSESLIETMSQIGETSEAVANNSSQLSSSAQALAEGATDQAGTVEELVATIAEVSEKIVGNAENAENANSMVSNTSTEVEESNRKMKEMIAAMENISEKSKEIANITATIEDIASQTNLLSLNAAIEAARAGESGKGFAVVAEQVKNLAVQSADAAKNVVELVEETLVAVEEGTEIVSATAGSLEKVVSSIDNVSDNAKGIAKASQEQAESMKQIEQGVEEISGVVQNNSAAAEESAAASEELDSQSQVLKDMINKFKF